MNFEEICCSKSPVLKPDLRHYKKIIYLRQSANFIFQFLKEVFSKGHIRSTSTPLPRPQARLPVRGTAL